jgi:hypothetical protein
MNYTYEKKTIYSKECVTELETGYFVIIEELSGYFFAFNFREGKEPFNEESSDALLRIKGWVNNNYPEYAL